MKEATGKQQSDEPLKASEVTSAMIKNASASGDGSIKRSEEESIQEEQEKGSNNKNENDEGIV